jgi:uncharacterized membrane protein
MSNVSNPAIDRYLTNLGRHLRDMPEPERTEVIQEIRNHAAEAIRAGEDPAAVIERFGAPRLLAQAYRVELAMSAPRPSVRRVGRVFAMLGVTAVSSLASFTVIVVLGALTLGFIGGGAAAIVGGLLSLLLPGEMISTALPIPQTISELLAIGVGVVLSLAGFVSGVLLFLYVRTVVRGFRRITGRLRAGQG